MTKISPLLYRSRSVDRNKPRDCTGKKTLVNLVMGVETKENSDEHTRVDSLNFGTQARSVDDLFEQCPANPWVFLALGMANSSDASEILCLSYILADPVFQNNILKESTGGVLTGSVFCGMLIGGLYIGIYSDQIGRHPALLAGLVLNGVAGLISCIVSNITQLCLVRFIAGIGIGATVPPLFALASELTSDSKRGLWVSVVASFWMIGSLFVAVVAWALLDNLGWRFFGTVCALPSCLGALLVYAVVPESPRYLLLQGNYEKALTAANRCLKVPSWTSEEVLHHYELSERRKGSTELSAWERFVPTIKDLFTNSLQTAVTLQIAWFSLSFASYGLLTWINRIFHKVGLENVYFNEILFASANLPGNVFAAIFLDRFGRSNVLSGSLWLAAVSLISFATFSQHQHLVVLSACVFQAASVSAWNSIDVVTSEGFPVSTRSTGLSVCAATGRIGAGIAQLCNAALIDSPSQLLILSSIMLVIGSFTPNCLPKSALPSVEAGYNQVHSS